MFYLTDASSVWAKVRQLTGRSKSSDIVHCSCHSRRILNDHYAAISTDAHYTAPAVKQMLNDQLASVHIAEWRMLTILDKLKPTATGLDELPAWFLRIGAPRFAKPLADMMNLSISSAVVPNQWNRASIRSVAKVASPCMPSDFRLISITPVLSRILERIVVRDFIYPALSTVGATATTSRRRGRPVIDGDRAAEWAWRRRSQGRVNCMDVAEADTYA